MSKPPGTTGVAGQPIESADWNTTIDDLITDANTARPVVAGGTGSGTAGAARTALDVPPISRHVVKTVGSYTAVAADRNQFWRCTGAVTLNLTAAATLTDGWCLWVRANGGAVTIDPNGAELIDGAATLVIPDGASCLIICTGTAFFAEFNTSAGSFSALTYTGLLTSPNSLKQDGRLTLTTAIPVTVSDVTAAGTIYYTPYVGNVISLYSGTAWVNRVFSEISLALTATSGKPYDVFVYDNAGVAALETLVWTDDTNRATALVRQDGVLCKTGALTRRYVGTFYASGANTTEDSAAKRYVWNMYNRAWRKLQLFETTDTWNYTLATFRQARATATNQVDVVRGLDEDPSDLFLTAAAANASAVNLRVGIGLDSTTAVAFDSSIGAFLASAAGISELQARYYGLPGLGRHSLIWLEYSGAAGTTVWRGDDGTPTLVRCGMVGGCVA